MKTVTLSLEEFNKIQKVAASLYSIVKRVDSIVDQERCQAPFDDYRIKRVLSESLKHIQVLEDFSKK